LASRKQFGKLLLFGRKTRGTATLAAILRRGLRSSEQSEEVKAKMATLSLLFGLGVQTRAA